MTIEQAVMTMPRNEVGRLIRKRLNSFSLKEKLDFNNEQRIVINNYFGIYTDLVGIEDMGMFGLNAKSAKMWLARSIPDIAGFLKHDIDMYYAAIDIDKHRKHQQEADSHHKRINERMLDKIAAAFAEK